jgi:hypothetical protein
MPATIPRPAFTAKPGGFPSFLKHNVYSDSYTPHGKQRSQSMDNITVRINKG